MKISQDKSAIVIRIISLIIIIGLVITIILPLINIFLAFNSGSMRRFHIPRKFSLDNKEIFKQGTLLNALFIMAQFVILTAMAAS